jgi:hypothetical protein
MDTVNMQVGGDHYKKRAIQPIDYILDNDLSFCEGCVIKYITRWRDKGGVEDLEKAKHYLEFLIEKHGRDALSQALDTHDESNALPMDDALKAQTARTDAHFATDDALKALTALTAHKAHTDAHFANIGKSHSEHQRKLDEWAEHQGKMDEWAEPGEDFTLAEKIYTAISNPYPGGYDD